MLARVTTWEGGTADGIRSASEEMRSNISQGPPPGIKSTGLTMLADPEGGRVLMIGVFASEDDLRDSEPVLKQMNPPEGLGKRTATDIFEVAAEPGRRRKAGPGGRPWRQQPCPNRPAGRLERRQLPCERRGSRGSGRGRPRRWAGPSGRPGGNPCRVCPRRPHSQKPRRPGKSGAAASIQRPPGSHPSGSLA